jgi:hypothetical protein
MPALVAFGDQNMTDYFDISTITAGSQPEHKLAARAAVEAERDAIDAEVQARYPGLAGPLVDLLMRQKAVDEKIRTLNPALPLHMHLDLVEVRWRHEPERPGASIFRVPVFAPKALYLSAELPAMRPGDVHHVIHWAHR